MLRTGLLLTTCLCASVFRGYIFWLSFSYFTIYVGHVWGDNLLPVHCLKIKRFCIWRAVSEVSHLYPELMEIMAKTVDLEADATMGWDFWEPQGEGEHIFLIGAMWIHFTRGRLYLITKKWPQILNGTFDQGVVSISLPFESGLGQEACFDQEDSSKCDASRDLNSIWTTGIALPPQREQETTMWGSLSYPPGGWGPQGKRDQHPGDPPL